MELHFAENLVEWSINNAFSKRNNWRKPVLLLLCALSPDLSSDQLNLIPGSNTDLTAHIMQCATVELDLRKGIALVESWAVGW
jgi:hypothetical protein